LLIRGHGRPQNFFPEEGKIFQSGGLKTCYLPLKCPKVKKHSILAGQVPPLALTADAHVRGPKKYDKIQYSLSFPRLVAIF